MIQDLGAFCVFGNATNEHSNVFLTTDFGLIFVSWVCENSFLMIAGDRPLIEYSATSASNTMMSWDIQAYSAVPILFQTVTKVHQEMIWLFP